MKDDPRIRRALLRAAHLGKFAIFNRILTKYPMYQFDCSLLTGLIMIADTTKDLKSIFCLRKIINPQNVNLVNPYGNTPLLIAVKFCGKNSVPVIVKARADLEAKDKRGLTALDIALDEHKLSTMAYLISQGARITSKEVFCFVMRNMMNIYTVSCEKQPINLTMLHHINVCWNALKKQHCFSMDKLDQHYLKQLNFFAKKHHKNNKVKNEKTDEIAYRSCVIL